MSQWENAQSAPPEKRWRAPGRVVRIARRFNLKASGHQSANRTRSPHMNVSGLGDATPDLLMFACEPSGAGEHTIDGAIEATSDRPRVDRVKLRRSAVASSDASYLVADAPPSPFAPELVADADEAFDDSVARLRLSRRLCTVAPAALFTA